MRRKLVLTGVVSGLSGMLMCASVFAAGASVPGATTVSVSLSGMSIVTKAGATSRVMAAATNLATVLHQITGATFPITTNGNGTAGIAIGVKGDFPSVSYFQSPPFDGCGTNCTQREDYLLLAHTTPSNGVYVCGSTEAGVENAVWDFLHKVGYRYYFPNAAWEMIPNNPTLAVNFNVHESPDFIQRNIWPQGGSGWPNQSEGVTNYIKWQKKNRNGSCVNPNMFGQWGWSSVIQAYPQEFNFSVHPDYFPMINGVRTNSGMLCPLNPAVEALCASYCTNYIATHPGEDVVSMVPPDTGTGFCESECQYCGTNSLSDRMVLLANYCGIALRNAGYINKRVCILVYSYYTSPPVNTIEPEVIPIVCNGYASGGKAMSFGDLINQWNAKRSGASNPDLGSTMGVYEYFSQVHWGADRPNKSLASDFNSIADEIPSLYNRYKIRYMSMESGVNFGLCGFGYYLATRLLWDTTESPATVRNEFLANCFGTAECQATMREFYDLISAGNRDSVVGDFDTVGKMYQLLQTALTQADGNTNVINRINQQVLYTRYCELYHTFDKASPGAAKTNAMEALATHMYRIKDLDLVHTFALWVTCIDPLLPAGDNRGAYIDEGTNPWKVMTPFAAGEYTAFITNGLAAHPPYPWSKRFSKDLVKTTSLNLPTVPTGYFCSNPGFSGDETLYTWIDPGSTSVTVYTKDVGNGQMMYLYSSVSSEANLEDRADVVHTAVWNVPATICEADRVTLGTTKTGLHRLRRMANFTQITWAEGVPMTIPTYGISLNWPDYNHEAMTMYFYVPKGTTNIWFTSTGGGCGGYIKDSSGVQRYNLYSDSTNEVNGIRSLAVPTGQDGKLWKIENYGGVVHFFNIPPYIARNGAELLLPREVVEADGPADYGMSVASTMYAGGTLPISWTAPAGHASLDWITIVNTNGIGCVDQRSFYTGTTNTSGVITNWAPTTPGIYTVRYFLNSGYTEVETIRKTLTVTAWPGSLSVTPSPVAPDDDMTINWTAPAGHAYYDWIAIINSQGGIYEYCLLNTTATSGSIELSAPTTPGDYTIRWMPNGQYEWVDSIPLAVGGVYSMSVASTMTAGGTLPISWTAPAGHASLDWITIVNTNGVGCVDQRSFYTGTTNTSGVITNWAPTIPGIYTVRYFLNSGYTEVEEIRKTLTVTAWPGSLTATPATVTPDGDLDIDWVAPTGHAANDWIGIYNDQNQWIQSCCPNTTATSGSIEWWAPSVVGNYTIRYFVNGNWESVCSIPLTVAVQSGSYSMSLVSTMTAGSMLPISWTAPAGHAVADWITILNTNGVGCVDQRSIATGTANTSGVMTNMAPTIPGVYPVCFFLAGGYTEVARSTLTVTAWPGSLAATPSTVVADDDLTINWTAPEGHSYFDWIAVCNPQGGIYEYCILYTTNTSGSIELSAPATAGNYTIRWMVNGSYEWVDSIPLTVQ